MKKAAVVEAVVVAVDVAVAVEEAVVVAVEEVVVVVVVVADAVARSALLSIDSRNGWLTANNAKMLHDSILRVDEHIIFVY